MKSPFPGMDPFLETHWRDVHTRLMSYICDALQDQLPGELVARIEEEVTIDSDRPAGAGNRLRPDVHLAESWSGGGGHGAAGAAATAAEPLVFAQERSAARDAEVERHVEILDSEGGRVISAIEVLSPSNRTARAGREAYLQKRRHYMAGEVSIVEIDLVRSGQHTVGVAIEEIPAEKRTTYYACAWRAAALRWELYPIALRERLPTIRIPLRPSDADVTLDLQTLIEEAYRRGRYDRLRYAAPLTPALPDADAEWMRTTLRAAGRLPA